MAAEWINGTAVAEAVRNEVRQEVEKLNSQGIVPGLAVILAGADPASSAYVNMKVRMCTQLGIYSRKLALPAETSTDELCGHVDQLNADPEIDGILIQLPLPTHVQKHTVLERVDPLKDVDGFHSHNLGSLFLGHETLAACTPSGVMELLRRYHVPLDGAHAVVLGRSDDVGKPQAALLLHANATVTICHSRTRHLDEITRQADVLVAAVGRPAMVTSRHVKPGAAVIDVGTNKVDSRADAVRLFGEDSARLRDFDQRGYIWVGDVHEREVREVAGRLTPVPGGVGPMTIAMLMKNTVKAARMRRAVR